MDKIIRYALDLGADYIEARLQDRQYEVVSFDTGVLKEYSVSREKGLGIRVFSRGYAGYAYTSELSEGSVREAVKQALSIARATETARETVRLAEKPVLRDKYTIVYREDPFEVDPESKTEIVREINTYSSRKSGIKSAVTVLGVERDRRLFSSSDGTDLYIEIVGVGIRHVAVAKVGNVIERAFDSESAISGYEFIEKRDWMKFVDEIDDLAIKAAQAKTPTPGTYTAVIDNDLIGLLLHEAFGHASEGDHVAAGGSILYGRLGQEVASKLVTIVDDGLVEGGYPVPYDDEGVPKKRTVIVEDGVLKHYLHSRYTANVMNQGVTGNARAQNYMFEPIVRQTNYYMLPGDYSVDELFEDVKYGMYLRARGSGGGQVNPAMGTFTFSIGPSYIIKNGEPRELVRSVAVSGMILETLKEIDAVAKDFKVRTSVFGGCGKAGQMARVGFGGPHVRTRKIVVGGEM